MRVEDWSRVVDVDCTYMSDPGLAVGGVLPM